MIPTQVARTTLAALALVVSAACGGGGAAPSGAPATTTTSEAGRPERPAERPPSPGSATTTTLPPADPAPVGIEPSRLTIERIGVDAPVTELGLAPDGTLEVPAEWEDTGWYTGGPRPGARGPAIIAGHVDSTSGPAVFFRLGELVPGDEIQVTGDDGTVRSFVVDRTERFAKAEFPTTAVYGLTPGPELRLVTCDGPFDTRSGHYQDNLVVYAGIAPTP